MTEKQTESSQDGTESQRTPATAIALFWLLVMLPLAWGVYNTGLQALQLLR